MIFRIHTGLYPEWTPFGVGFSEGATDSANVKSS